jgi:hypothetical protein
MGSCFSNHLACQCYCNRQNNRANSVSSTTDHHHQHQQQVGSIDGSNFINLTSTDTISLNNNNNNNVPTGRNKRIKKDKFKWKSDISLNEIELDSKRDEFWDTAPAFGGRVEIWNALKAICAAIDTSGNYELAQVIIDSAQIILPNGTLNDCYDELGNHYQLPNYVITKPVNLKKCLKSTTIVTSEIVTTKPVLALAPDVVLNSNSSTTTTTATPRQEIQLKFRLSNNFSNSDLKIIVNQNDTIDDVKKKIFSLRQIDACRQRMYFGGKLLVDRVKVKDIKLEKNFVIQVIVRDEPDVEQQQQAMT